ncbi:MAG TPA: tetratricopeptide repeat protein [Candidatus Obscuribacterales bacterium]
MTSSLKDKIAEARDMRSALEIVSSEAELSGALKISAAGTKGAVAFARGKLVGAFVDKSGETGQAALSKLMDLSDATVKYAKFDENQIVTAERIDVDIKQLLAGAVSNAGAPPILNKMQEVVASSASPPAEKIQSGAGAEDDNSTVEIKADPALVDFLRNKSATPPKMRPADHKSIAHGNGSESHVEQPQPVVPAEPKAKAPTPTPKVEEPKADAPEETKDAQESEAATIPETMSRHLDEVFDPDLTPAITFPTLLPNERLTEDDENRTVEVNMLTGEVRPIEPRESGLTEEQKAELEASKQSAPPEEFVATDGLLDMSDRSLTDQQKHLLNQLGQSMADAEAFHETDPELATLNEEQGLTDHQMELLANAPLDEKPFELTEKRIENDLPSLNDQQRKALDLAKAEQRDIESFEQLDDFLTEKGLQLTSDQLWQLGEVMFARGRDEMLEEFQRMDHRMKLPEKAEFREFIEHDTPPPPDVSDLDSIPTPKTIDADYAPLIAMQEGLPQPKAKTGVDGIIGRMRDAIAGRLGVYEGPKKQEADFPIGKLIGALTLMGLCLGIFTIPAAIREAATGKSSEQLAQEQMRILIEEDISSETPNTARDEVRSHYGGPQGSSSGGSGAGGEGGGDVGTTATLAFARSLAAKGNLEAAIGYYEQAIAANPASIGARIELIQAYLTTKKYPKARQMCLATLKCRLTDSEIALVWSLLRQCLSN